MRQISGLAALRNWECSQGPLASVTRKSRVFGVVDRAIESYTNFLQGSSPFGTHEQQHSDTARPLICLKHPLSHLWIFLWCFSLLPEFYSINVQCAA